MKGSKKEHIQSSLIILYWVVVITTIIGCKDFNNDETPYGNKINIRLNPKNISSNIEAAPYYSLYAIQEKKRDNYYIKNAKDRYVVVCSNDTLSFFINGEEVEKEYKDKDKEEIAEELHQKLTDSNKLDRMLSCNELEVTLRTKIDHLIRKIFSNKIYYTITKKDHSTKPKVVNNIIKINVSNKSIDNPKSNSGTIQILLETFGFNSRTTLKVDYKKTTYLISPQCGMQRQYTLTNVTVIDNNASTEKNKPVDFLKNPDIKIKKASLELKQEDESNIEISY